MTGIEAIREERSRQVSDEGWTLEHDDAHDTGELIAAALCYIRHGNVRKPAATPSDWPWHRSWWKPRDRRSNLVRAGALIAAEIDRLDRLSRREEV